MIDRTLSGSDWLDRIRSAEASRTFGRVGRYDMQGEIGRGAQGVVYRAVDTETGEVVALKRLFTNDRDPARRRRRLETEIAALRALSHEGVVRVLDVVTEGASVFIVMEWVDGVTLDAWVTRSGPSQRECVEVVVGMCEVLEHAHERGVLHRDLKPTNVLVDRNARPHVLDFGLAKLQIESPSASSSVPFVGTMAYASPESIARGPGAIDAKSDIYSLGVILYELLYGRPPVQMGDSISQAVLAVLHDEPAFGDERVEPALESIVRAALAKRPEDRYATVQAMRENLEGWLKGDLAASRRNRGGRHGFVPALRRQPALAAACLAAVVIAGFLIARGVSSVDAGSSDGTEPAATFLKQVGVNASVAASARPTVSTLRDASRRVAVRFDGEPVAQVHARNILASHFSRLGEWRDVAEQATRARALMEHAEETAHPAYTVALGHLGAAWAHLQMVEADAMLSRVLEMESSRPVPNPAVMAYAHSNRAIHLTSTVKPPDYLGAEHEYSEAFRWYETTQEPPHDWVRTLWNYARLKKSFGEGPAAIRAYERALDVLARLPQSDALPERGLHEELGDVLKSMGRHAEAEVQYRWVVQSPGPMTTNVPANWSKLGTSLRMRGEYEQALECFETAIARRLEWLSERNEGDPRFLDLAAEMRTRGLDAENTLEIAALLRERAPQIVYLFLHTSGEVRKTYELLGEHERAASLEHAREHVVRTSPDVLPKPDGGREEIAAVTN